MFTSIFDCNWSKVALQIYILNFLCNKYHRDAYINTVTMRRTWTTIESLSGATALIRDPKDAVYSEK